MAIPTIGQIKKAALVVGKKHDLKLAVLYGSLAKGKAKSDSDIDIAVLGKSVLNLSDIIDIADELTAALKINEIDVKSLHFADPLFRHQVMERSVLLYGGELDFVSFKIYAFRDYVESKSLFVLKEKLVKKRLESLWLIKISLLKK